MLGDHLILQPVKLGGKAEWFMQDGVSATLCTPNLSLATSHYETFPGLWIGRRGAVEWDLR
jgi:hypothetical protein